MAHGTCRLLRGVAASVQCRICASPAGAAACEHCCLERTWQPAARSGAAAGCHMLPTAAGGPCWCWCSQSLIPAPCIRPASLTAADAENSVGRGGWRWALAMPLEGRCRGSVLAERLAERQLLLLAGCLLLHFRGPVPSDPVANAETSMPPAAPCAAFSSTAAHSPYFTPPWALFEGAATPWRARSRGWRWRGRPSTRTRAPGRRCRPWEAPYCSRR